MRMSHHRPIALAAAGVVASLTTGAHAQDYGDPAGRSWTLAGDVRAIAADGERSWLDGGFGKARFGAVSDGDRDAQARAIEGDVVWQPQLGWSVGTTLAVTAQHGQEHAVDLSEAFASWRGGPHAVRLSGRAGLYWPPVSLEHAGPEWRVAETITPSAINSWIGEEVKVGGAELTAAASPGRIGRVHATLGLFGFNDTAGTLLAFRGWALHDEKATAFGRQPLPPLDTFLVPRQAARTRPVSEIDHRVGGYISLSWSPSAAVSVQAFHYDNRGDPEAVTSALQWGWRTKFTDIGATLALPAGTRLTAQAMSGSTVMGYPRHGVAWVYTDFRSAFLLATRQVGGGAVSARIEAFGTSGEGSVVGADESEDGWAATLAARHPIGRHATLLGELLHVDSDRATRTRAGLAPRQRQTVVQLALRLHS